MDCIIQYGICYIMYKWYDILTESNHTFDMSELKFSLLKTQFYIFGIHLTIWQK